MNAMSRWEQAQKTLGSISTSLKYIEKKLEKEEEFKNELRGKQSTLEREVAVTNQILRDLSDSIRDFQGDQDKCRSECDEKIMIAEKISRSNQIEIEKTRAIIKWSMAAMSLIVPGMIGLANAITNYSIKSETLALQKEQISLEKQKANTPSKNNP